MVHGRWPQEIVTLGVVNSCNNSHRQCTSIMLHKKCESRHGVAERFEFRDEPSSKDFVGVSSVVPESTVSARTEIVLYGTRMPKRSSWVTQ